MPSIWKRIGPGVVTGASDDDPSGILTYLITGAQSGLSLIWLSFVTIPLMVSVQEMCARIGLVTRKGIVGNLKKLFPSWFLYLLCLLVVAANTLNIAADLAGMVSALKLVIPLPTVVLGSTLVAIILLSLIFFSYRKLAIIFRWLTLPLFAYIAAALLSNLNFRNLFINTFTPRFTLNKASLTLICAVVGTTISPYLFFWQASEEVEERSLLQKKTLTGMVKDMRLDVVMGMLFSNIVMYFIIAAGSSAFHARGIYEIANLGQAAESLKPFAGNFSALLFTIGVLGTGILAIPVLAGSAAYVVGETFGWKQGLGLSFSKAPRFYLVIILTTLAGLVAASVNLDPIKLLFYTALIYGIISPILIGLIMFIANNKNLMGSKTNGLLSNTINLIGLAVMSSIAIALFVV